MYMDMQNTKYSQNKGEKAEYGDFTLLDFRIYYRTTIINTVLCSCENRHLGQWDTID